MRNRLSKPQQQLCSFLSDRYDFTDFPRVILKLKRAQRAANEADHVLLEKPVSGALRAANIGVRRITK